MAMPRHDDPDKDRGLYPKFKVERLNADAQERHAGCDYFVLDISHDRFAIKAIEAYAESAEAHGYKTLADDLRRKVAAARRRIYCL